MTIQINKEQILDIFRNYGELYAHGDVISFIQQCIKLNAIYEEKSE